MLKIYVTILFCLAAFDYRLFVNGYANECSVNMECRKIKRCKSETLHDKRERPYCNLKQRGTFVCCPVPPPKYIQPKDENKRAVRECKSYQSIRKCEKPLIVGGKKTEPKEFPFMALLSYYNGREHQWLCGGTLISKKFVLSAAHCFYVDNTPNKVRLGELDYSTKTVDALPTDFDIKGEVTLHPHYNYTTKLNDIALVELDGEATFSEYIMPACLPLADGRKFDKFTATGWGAIGTAEPSSTHLLKVQLDSFNEAMCQKIFDGTLLINTTLQMCAGSFSEERDTCTGDSGGPLFVDHPDYDCMFMILGVTSYSQGGCATINYPGFYTRVSAYVDWIEGIVWR